MTLESPTYWEAKLHAQDFQKHPSFLHPPCAGCGMPLEPNPGRDDLICHYCGLRHHFLKPPDPTEKAHFRIGDNVAAEWKGNWWFAHVVDELENEEKWRVHFIGWAPAFDAEVDASRIRAIDYFPGDTIIQPRPQKPQQEATEVQRSTSPAAAIILVLLTVLGFAVLFLFPQALNVPSGQFHPDTSGLVIGMVSEIPVTAQTPVTVGQRLHVQWENSWYTGTAAYVDTKTGDITVRYTRWGMLQEEIVPRERLRLVR